MCVCVCTCVYYVLITAMLIDRSLCTCVLSMFLGFGERCRPCSSSTGRHRYDSICLCAILRLMMQENRTLVVVFCPCGRWRRTLHTCVRLIVDILPFFCRQPSGEKALVICVLYVWMCVWGWACGYNMCIYYTMLMDVYLCCRL